MADVEDTRECEAMRKMFVGGLNRDTSDEAFFEHFAAFGNMLDKVVIKDPSTRVSRGFGFITYENSDCVENVFQNRPHVLDGKTLDCKRAMPREFNTSTAHSKVTKLFVGGIGPDLAPEDLQEYIESRHPTTCGTIDKIDFMKDKETNKNKGFGFLECSSPELADRLTISENQFTLKGKQMSLKKAEPKGEAGGDRGRGRGGRGGFQSRGGGRGRGGGGRGRGGSFSGRQDNGYNNGGGYNNSNGGGYNDYSTGYPGFGGNAGYNNYQQPQAAGGNYGGGYGGGYGANQGQQQGGWNQNQGGGGNRYQPY